MKTNRLSDLVHYIIWRCDPAELGATKLNKICWYADLEYYRLTGRTITGADRYKRLQFGPAPKNVHMVIDALEREEKIAVASENYYGKPKTMFMARSRPDLTAFSGDEIATVDQIADVICSKHTAASISNASHDALWQEIELGEDIPIAAASVIPGEITAEDIDWAEKAVAQIDADSSSA
jgi:Protein of unknown function (DUF4065)